MTREMFSTGEDAGRFQAFRIGNRSARYFIFIFSKGAITDYGISSIIIDIGYRRKTDIDTDGFELLANGMSHFFNASDVRDRAKHDLMWKRKTFFFKTHSQSPFRIHADQQGYVTQFLIRSGQLSLLERGSL